MYSIKASMFKRLPDFCEEKGEGDCFCCGYNTYVVESVFGNINVS